ncbi:MFS transporter [Candidatus Bealeia paramacronuclearis]|uniref:MFS transporter n=1 Tax=Candidatus Bealeia paramacronuclearis TaxID=1921001 RepID=A0ABZ2C420_9PROT|nr:MFS transporter [Candidatus Bealeia paramacronuclearis]
MFYFSESFSRRDVSILLGNMLDHFDAGLYGFLAPVLAPLFFPTHDPVVQLILAYSILATSLITRPLGSIIFSIMARRRGALWALSYSLLGASVTTFLMGCVPTYEMCGWMGPLSLLLLRGFGGIFAAGEATVAQLYILHQKPFQQGLKASQYYHSTSMAGMILASFAATLAIIGGTEVAWRICFFAGSFAGVVGFLIRYFAKQEPEKIRKAPIAFYGIAATKSVMKLWKIVLALSVVSGFSYMTYAIPCIFMNSFVPLISDHSLETMMELNTAFLIIDLILIPLLGSLLIKQNPTHVMGGAVLILAFTCPILFHFLPQSSLLYISFVRLWIIFWGVVFLCPLSQWYRSLVGTTRGYLILGIAQALGTSTLGRLTPSLGLWLWEETSLVDSPAMWFSFCAIGVFTILKMYPFKTQGNTKQND